MSAIGQIIISEGILITTIQCVLIDTSNTFTVPSNFISLVSIEGIGAGGQGIRNNTAGSRKAAGGGAYSITTIPINAISAGSVYNIQIGIQGGNQGNTSSPGIADTWFNSATGTLYAQGAVNATTSGVGAPGISSNCYPIIGAYSGGTANNSPGGCGGGAAGKNGAGGDATAGIGGTGGQGDNGTGGMGGSSSGAANTGTEWSYTQYNTTIVSGVAGSGGGGASQGVGANYGGGGGPGGTGTGTIAGANGCIFFTFNGT